MNQLLYYFNEGGIIMWPLALCSLLAIAVILERAVRLRRSVLIDAAVIDDFQSHIEQGKLETAVARHHNSPVLIGQILSKGLDDYRQKHADIETALSESARHRLPALQRYLNLLNLIAKVAPLLGLLGTVLGMIMGFEVLEKAGVGKENLAHAIRVALITTAAGLMIAIPTVVAGTYFHARIRAIYAEMDEILRCVVRTVKRMESSGKDQETQIVLPGRSKP